jgi:hypothetical protein
MEGTMHDSPDKPKAIKARPQSAQSREDRLKAALKANMARRKAQAQVRAKARADNDKEDE